MGNAEKTFLKNREQQILKVANEVIRREHLHLKKS